MQVLLRCRCLDLESFGRHGASYSPRLGGWLSQEQGVTRRGGIRRRRRHRLALKKKLWRLAPSEARRRRREDMENGFVLFLLAYNIAILLLLHHVPFGLLVLVSSFLVGCRIHVVTDADVEHY